MAWLGPCAWCRRHRLPAACSCRGAALAIGNAKRPCKDVHTGFHGKGAVQKILEIDPLDLHSNGHGEYACICSQGCRCCVATLLWSRRRPRTRPLLTRRRSGRRTGSGNTQTSALVQLVAHSTALWCKVQLMVTGVLVDKDDRRHDTGTPARFRRAHVSRYMSPYDVDATMCEGADILVPDGVPLLQHESSGEDFESIQRIHDARGRAFRTV